MCQCIMALCVCWNVNQQTSYNVNDIQITSVTHFKSREILKRSSFELAFVFGAWQTPKNSVLLTHMGEECPDATVRVIVTDCH